MAGRLKIWNDSLSQWEYVTYGLPGDTGTQGDTGASGDTGVQGDTGIQGDTGDQGDTGVPGDTGITGDTGIPGTAVEKGDTGDQGDTGVSTLTYRIPHTWAIPGEIAVPSGDTDFIVPFFVKLPAGQTASLAIARYVINSGTSVTCKLQVNGVDVTGFTGISVTTTPADTDPTDDSGFDPGDVALANNDKVALVVTAVSGTPTNMTFTIFIDWTVTG